LNRALWSTVVRGTSKSEWQGRHISYPFAQSSMQFWCQYKRTSLSHWWVHWSWYSINLPGGSCCSHWGFLKFFPYLLVYFTLLFVHVKFSLLAGEYWCFGSTHATFKDCNSTSPANGDQFLSRSISKISEARSLQWQRWIGKPRVLEQGKLVFHQVDISSLKILLFLLFGLWTGTGTFHLAWMHFKNDNPFS
jgi:hypothetical protein